MPRSCDRAVPSSETKLGVAALGPPLAQFIASLDTRLLLGLGGVTAA
eukprot:SAG11_NODE_23634_length_385_cov_0.895105_1_plen_46_part_10